MLGSLSAPRMHHYFLQPSMNLMLAGTAHYITLNKSKSGLDSLLKEGDRELFYQSACVHSLVTSALYFDSQRRKASENHLEYQFGIASITLLSLLLARDIKPSLDNPQFWVHSGFFCTLQLFMLSRHKITATIVRIGKEIFGLE